ncbi:MAG TPA: VanZ family protein [Albitalea sp.]|uniref:VanZ family protein n=1 Tax=Piscinibacter sp. TaxID=1903157 RepID=UPI002ED3CC07
MTPIARSLQATNRRAALLRWLPFTAAALFSLVMSARAPLGRHAYFFDWTLSWDALEYSIFKLPHIGSCALLAVLGVFAAGAARWSLSLRLTVLVGFGWELCQTTVIGHYARLTDLAPDTVGALIGCAIGVMLLRRFQPTP